MGRVINSATTSEQQEIRVPGDEKTRHQATVHITAKEIAVIRK